MLGEDRPDVLRFVLFEEEDVFMAICLERYIGVQGATQEEVEERLRIVYRAELDASRERGEEEPFGHIPPAPEEYHDMWEKGPRDGSAGEGSTTRTPSLSRSRPDMSSPDRQPPTWGEYCEWLVAAGGQVRQKHNDWGGYTELVPPYGSGSVCKPGNIPAEERLTPRSLRLLDSRLGVSSPFRLQRP